VAAALRDLESEAPIAGIYSSSEYFIEAAATLAAGCGLTGPKPAAIAACRNKWRQRQILAGAGLAPLRFSRITDANETLEALREHTLPVVVKPTMGTGSVGVKLCRSAEQVQRHAEVLLSRRTNERGTPIPQEVLIEEYVEGPEYSLESFGRQVIGITRKHVSPEPFFVETGHDFPASLPAHTTAAVNAVVLSALKALDLTWGPNHTEFRLTSLGPVIMEVNPRLAGGFIPELVRLALGVDLIEASVALVAGREPSVRVSQNLHSSIRFLACPGDGEIVAVNGMGEAASIGGVADIQLYKQAGDYSRVEHDFRDRVGHIITRSHSAATAASAAEHCRSHISFQLASLVT